MIKRLKICLSLITLSPIATEAATIEQVAEDTGTITVSLDYEETQRITAGQYGYLNGFRVMAPARSMIQEKSQDKAVIYVRADIKKWRRGEKVSFQWVPNPKANFLRSQKARSYLGDITVTMVGAQKSSKGQAILFHACNKSNVTLKHADLFFNVHNHNLPTSETSLMVFGLEGGACMYYHFSLSKAKYTPDLTHFQLTRVRFVDQRPFHIQFSPKARKRIAVRR